MPTITPSLPSDAYSTGGTATGYNAASSGSSVGQKIGITISVTCDVWSVKGGAGLGCNGHASVSYSTDGGTTWTSAVRSNNGAGDFSGTTTINLSTATISQIQIATSASSGASGGEGSASVSAWSITYSDARRRVYVC